MSYIRKFIDIVSEAATPIERKRRVSDAEFIKLAQEKAQGLGYNPGKMNLPDMAAFADAIGIQIPTTIRHNRELKIGAHHWNLSGQSADDADVDKKVAKDLNIDVEAPSIEDDAEVRLANVRKARGLISSGKIYMFGRKPKGAFFRIQGADEMLATLERAFVRELEIQGDATMEQQYDDLKERIKLIASGRSSRIRSLLLTGAPRSGKTHTVIETLKAMGLKEDKDFVVKKGKSSAYDLYTSLIEQIHGLTVYDDCDDVIKEDSGINMLKNALDSNPIRDVGYNVKTALNVSVLPREERNLYVDIVAKLMKAQPISSEEMDIIKEVLNKLRMLSVALKGVKKNKNVSDDEDADDFDEDTSEDDAIAKFAISRLPNKIDFDGRMIFISNLDVEDWPDAIVQRATTQNMNFRDDEMLDFIDRILPKIDTNLSEEEKREVWDYVKDLWKTGKLKSRVSFGLAFEAFDLRLTPNWKRMISQL